MKAAGGPTAPPGKIIAELSFGFWRYLSSAAHEKRLWVPYLHHAFPPGTDRAPDVDAPVSRLLALRNRVAHLESLVDADLQGGLTDLLLLAELLQAPFADYLRATTAVPRLLGSRP